MKQVSSSTTGLKTARYIIRNGENYLHLYDSKLPVLSLLPFAKKCGYYFAKGNNGAAVYDKQTAKRVILFLQRKNFFDVKRVRI